MNQAGKDLLTSKTTWGGLLVLLAPMLSGLGIEINDQEVTAQAVTTIVGALLAVYGQLKRKAPITSVLGVPIK